MVCQFFFFKIFVLFLSNGIIVLPGVVIARTLLLYVSLFYFLIVVGTLSSVLLMAWVFLLLIQTYENVATAFKFEDDVVIANLDADKYKDLAEK